MSGRRGKRGTGDVWDVKGKDVPGGRVSRSLVKGLSRVKDAKERARVKKERRAALNRLRAHARNMEDERDRRALWDLIPKIGLAGYPTWEEVVNARTRDDFLTLALRGELHIETNARRDRDARVSERRTCSHSVDEYLDWREKEEFSAEGNRTVTSILRRALAVEDSDETKYAERRVATIGYEDANRILSELAVSDRLPEGRTTVARTTQDKNRRYLTAWFNWELQRESERAQDQNRAPLFSTNPFASRQSAYSQPVRHRYKTIQQKEESRRFFPEEVVHIEAHADPQLRHAIPVTHRLGLRPGELVHARWLEEVIPLENGRGYEVRLEGGRGRDPRCSCPACQSEKGWAPKNGPRRYVLDRSFDQIDWIAHACDALDSWVAIRRPKRGDFLFPSYSDRNSAWTNQDLNRRLKKAARKAGIPVGMRSVGRRTAHSFRHACACELLERGVPHPLVAAWIGDSLQTFMKTYGRPKAEMMARVTLARYERSEGV